MSFSLKLGGARLAVSSLNLLGSAPNTRATGMGRTTPGLDVDAGDSNPGFRAYVASALRPSPLTIAHWVL